jgi:hypothetical protein
MSKLFGFLGATIVGTVGWYLGALVGFWTGFVLSGIGSGVGLYYGRKIAREHFE